jgi:hypothetical protein
VPPLPAVAKVIKTDLIWSDEVNTDIVTRFFAEYSGSAPSDADLDGWCASLADAYESALAGLANPNVILSAINAIDLSSATGAIGVAAPAVTGTRTGDPVSIGTAVVDSYSIARRYRGGHPRGYWPFGNSLDLGTLQTWADAFVAEAQSEFNAWWLDVGTSGWSGAGTINHVNVSYFSGFTVVINPMTGRARNVPTLRGIPIVDLVAGTTVRTKVGTQRRRLQYG